MSNDVTTSDGGSRMTPQKSKRRALWAATGVAGLTGVVGLAAIGGIAARDNKSGGAERVADTRAAMAGQRVSDGGTAGAEEKKGEAAAESGGKKEDKNRSDVEGRDGKGEDEHVVTVPCDAEELDDAVFEANEHGGAVLKLTKDCTYKLEDPLPKIKVEVDIKGEGATIKPVSGATFRVFEVAAGGDLDLQDLTVKGGRAGNGNGGALLVDRGGEASLERTKLTENTARFGGAIANYGITKLEDSEVSRNTAKYDGGGIFNTGVLKVEGSGGKGGESRISDNSAGRDGGAVANKHGFVLVKKTVIDNNTAERNGGAFHTDGGIVKVADSKVSHNNACAEEDNGNGEDEDTGGGGFYTKNKAQLFLDHVIVDGNHTGENGGGIANTEHSVTVVEDSAITNNKAENGAGLFNDDDSEAVLRHTKVRGNQATEKGGGIFNEGENNEKGKVTLIKSKITKNLAGIDGGGIWNKGTVVNIDSIIKENDPNNCAPSGSVPDCND